MKRFIASLFLLGAILTGGAFAQTPGAKVVLLGSGNGSCPASVRLSSLPAQYQCPAVSLQLASGTAWVHGTGFVPLSSLLSITNPTGGYVTDWSGAMTWAYGPITNLVSNSQNFASWTTAKGATGTVTVTANFAASPIDGTQTAGRIQLSANSDFALAQVVTGTIPSTGSYVGAIWMKSNTGSTYPINIFSDQGSTCSVSVTPSWQRFVCVESLTSGVNNKFQIIAGGSNIDILAWGAQVNSLPYPTATAVSLANMPYVPTTTGTATSTAQLRQANGTGLLAEEARTNLLLNSQNFGGTGWANTASTITANNLTAPDGTLTGSTIAESNTTTSEIHQDVTTAANAAYAGSIFLKYIDTPWVLVNVYDQVNTLGGRMWVNIQTCTKGTVQAIGTGTVSGFTPQWFGSWCGLALTTTPGGAGTVIRTQINSASADASFTRVVGSRGQWGAMLRQSSSWQSYCPTTTTAIVCQGDVILTAGALAAIRQSGTVLASFSMSSIGTGRQQVWSYGVDAANNNRLNLGANRASGGQPQFTVGNGSGISSLAPAVTLGANVIGRSAAAWDSVGSSMATNGTLATGGNGWAALAQTSYVGSNNGVDSFLNGTIQRLDFWSLRIPDALLQLISTPQPVLVTDFANSLYTWNGYNLGAGALTSLFSVANSGGYCTNGAGSLVGPFSANTLRICSGTGLLPEDTRTNSTFNSPFAGASAGVSPTGWSVQTTNNGVTSTMVGPASENGMSCVDVAYTGTATNVTAVSFIRSSTTEVPAVQNQTWTSSVYFRVVSGVGPTGVTVSTIQRGAAGAYIGENGISFVPTSSFQRGSATLLLSNVNAAFAQQYWYAQFPNGSTVNATLRYCSPQLEQGSFPTSYYPSATAASATRNFDNIQALGPVLNLLGTQGANSMVAAWQQNQYYASNAAPNRQFVVANGSDAGNARWNVRSAESLTADPSFVVGDGTTNSTVPSSPTNIAAGAPSKFAWRWNNSSPDAAASINGGVAATAARQFGGSISPPFYIGSANGSSGLGLSTYLGCMAIFPGGLTNTQLQAPGAC